MQLAPLLEGEGHKEFGITAGVHAGIDADSSSHDGVTIMTKFSYVTL